MVSKIKVRPEGYRRFSAVYLLVALLLLFICCPMLLRFDKGTVIESVMVTFVLLSALFAISGRVWVVIGILLAVPALSGEWGIPFTQSPASAPFSLLPAIAFILLVVLHLLRFIMKSEEVGIETICASIAGFLMIGLLWSRIYELVGTIDPRAFVFEKPGDAMSSFTAFYFSFISLTTLGFGDITPASPAARMMVVMEAITGMFYMAIIVATLVSINGARILQRHKPDSPEDKS